MVYRYNIYMDNSGWICIFDKHYGSIFKKDHSVDTEQNTGSRRSIKCVEVIKQRREIKDPLIIHSDRGIHFTCRKIQ